MLDLHRQMQLVGARGEPILLADVEPAALPGGHERQGGQRFDEDATVVQRLDAEGAVLIAKLTLGELAMGDVWFGGTTKNPWNVEQGSSGSSAGPASATAAGLVGFAIGSETQGSISSPSWSARTSSSSHPPTHSPAR